VRLYFTYDQYDNATPVCPTCDSQKLRRLISRVAVSRSEESRLSSLEDDSFLAGLDEEDPRSLGRAMRRMNQEMGEDLGPEFDEVVERLESGQSPEAIEKSMPGLSDESAGAFDDDI
jgi:hypothetical protein